jgi:hypothetical protein
MPSTCDPERDKHVAEEVRVDAYRATLIVLGYLLLIWFTLVVSYHPSWQFVTLSFLSIFALSWLFLLIRLYWVLPESQNWLKYPIYHAIKRFPRLNESYSIERKRRYASTKLHVQPHISYTIKKHLCGAAFGLGWVALSLHMGTSGLTLLLGLIPTYLLGVCIYWFNYHFEVVLFRNLIRARKSSAKQGSAQLTYPSGRGQALTDPSVLERNTQKDLQGIKTVQALTQEELRYIRTTQAQAARDFHKRLERMRRR